MGAHSKIIDELVQRIVEEVHSLRIILFGSAVIGEVRANSDIDLLVNRCLGSLCCWSRRSTSSVWPQ